MTQAVKKADIYELDAFRKAKQEAQAPVQTPTVPTYVVVPMWVMAPIPYIAPVLVLTDGAGI